MSNRETEGVDEDEDEERLVSDGSGSQRKPGRGFDGVGKDGVEARLKRGVCFVGPEDLGVGDGEDVDAEGGVEVGVGVGGGVGVEADASSMAPEVDGVSAELTIGSVSIGLDPWLMRSTPFSDGVEGLSARRGRVKSNPTREELAKEHAPTRARDGTPTRFEGRTADPNTERSTTDAMMLELEGWIK